MAALHNRAIFAPHTMSDSEDEPTHGAHEEQAGQAGEAATSIPPSNAAEPGAPSQRRCNPFYFRPARKYTRTGADLRQRWS